jgi:hypothetical protein
MEKEKKIETDVERDPKFDRSAEIWAGHACFQER